MLKRHSTWKRPCQQIQNGSEFPELAAQNFRNPHPGTALICIWNARLFFIERNSARRLTLFPTPRRSVHKVISSDAAKIRTEDADAQEPRYINSSTNERATSGGKRGSR
jgi:hypothetical protein